MSDKLATDRLGPLTDDLLRAVSVPFRDEPDEETVRLALAALAYVTSRILVAAGDIEMVEFYYAVLRGRMVQETLNGVLVQ
jgi:hypothetical protein